MLECIANVSEGRDAALIDVLAEVCGDTLLDTHSDPDHNRSVLTLAGGDEDVVNAVRVLARTAVERLSVVAHHGVHPRLGVLDVVPFVSLDRSGAPRDEPQRVAVALAARDRFAQWAAQELELPCFYYGPQRPLPEVRRRAFRDLMPDIGPSRPHPTAGACAVGARGPLVAYNLWLDSSDVSVARAIASEVRRDNLRTMGFSVAGVTQVACNLVRPSLVGPAEAYDLVASAARRHAVAVTRAELVGLLPASTLEALPPSRYVELDVGPDRTVEARLARRRSQ
ncbi:MAG: hypothetical protein ACYDD4_11060 [Acidimicrobiales bacterium]